MRRMGPKPYRPKRYPKPPAGPSPYHPSSPGYAARNRVTSQMVEGRKVITIGDPNA